MEWPGFDLIGEVDDELLVFLETARRAAIERRSCSGERGSGRSLQRVGAMPPCTSTSSSAPMGAGMVVEGGARPRFRDVPAIGVSIGERFLRATRAPCKACSLAKAVKEGKGRRGCY